MLPGKLKLEKSNLVDTCEGSGDNEGFKVSPVPPEIKGENTESWYKEYRWNGVLGLISLSFRAKRFTAPLVLARGCARRSRGVLCVVLTRVQRLGA